ncbi:hypothetical protein Ahy_B04g070734 isoform C [Arachis hypogaea]|uniref:Uncharacterized protein n=1 Tax=Arachis hypogaea TaxID=3818 RepID=A0A444ZIP7_ARAHY|nr:hypothetical protein Ahy_B04g070734 isoform C [Arachis hypogaea]
MCLSSAPLYLHSYSHLLLLHPLLSLLPPSSPYQNSMSSPIPVDLRS